LGRRPRETKRRGAERGKGVIFQAYIMGLPWDSKQLVLLNRSARRGFTIKKKEPWEERNRRKNWGSGGKKEPKVGKLRPSKRGDRMREGRY